MRKFIILLLTLVLFSGCDFFIAQKNKPKIRTSESKIIHISNYEMFDEFVIYPNKSAVVKFETKWCGACKTMAPIYELFANKYSNKINFVRVQADKLSELADKYMIKGVPTFIFFKDGKKINQLIGTVSEDRFEEELKKIL